LIGASSNARRVMERLQQQIARMQDLSVPLTRSGIIVRDAAVTRIKQQGGDQSWPPNKRGGHTGILSGRMWQSIGISQNNVYSVTIGTNVPYARWFQEGTGIFAGHSPWTVRAKNAKALKFTVGGKTYLRKAVTIPGQPPRPFLLIGDSERAKIRQAFENWFMLRSGTSVRGVDLG